MPWPSSPWSRPDGRIAAAGEPDQAPNAQAGNLEVLRAARGGSAAVTFEAAPEELAAQGAGLLIGRGRAADGRPFDGAVLAVLRAEAFFTVWAQATSRSGARFALVRDDGTIVLRQNAAPGMPASLGPDDAPRAIALNGPGGTRGPNSPQAPLTADPFGDAAAQFVFWRPLGSLPLNIVYTVPADPVQRSASVTTALIALALFP